MSGAVGGQAVIALASVRSGLLDIEKARDAIAACKDVDEAKDIHDKAAAVHVYLRAKGAALEAQNDAAEIALYAHRRMGQLVDVIVQHEGGRPPKNSPRPGPLLAEIGITKNESASAQKLAAMPDEVFAEKVQAARDDDGRLTLAAVIGRHVAKEVAPSLQKRRTPRPLFDFLNERFGPFQLDAYADAENALLPNFRTKEQDGNSGNWLDVTFGNPEFKKGESAGMALAVEQAVRQADRGIRSCLIGPAICSQDWAHRFAIRGTIWLPDERIHFDTPDGKPTGPGSDEFGSGADRDSVVMTFGQEHANGGWKKGIFRVRALRLERAESDRGVTIDE